MTAVLVEPAMPIAQQGFDLPAGSAVGPYWTKTGVSDIGISATGMLTALGTTVGRRGVIYNEPTATAAQFVELVVGTTPNNTAGSGAVLRCNIGMTQMVLLTIAAGSWSIGRITGINGSFSLIGNHPTTIALGDVVRVTVDEYSVYRVYINGARSGPAFRDTTWADISHRYRGAWIQYTSGTAGAALDNFVSGDTPPLTLVDGDNFDLPVLTGWTTSGGGTLYVQGGEISGVGTPSEPISFAHRAPLSGYPRIMVARLQIRWNGRNPLHSATSVCVGANLAAGHTGVHFWTVANQCGICIYDPAYTDGFLPATGTPAGLGITKWADGGMLEIRREGTHFSSAVDHNPVMWGTYTDAQAPLLYLQGGVQIQDDSAVSGGGEPPANGDNYQLLVA
ncbi:hypothetical protein [Nocardia wallacei]|uniref:hypothetical protein n=1 Tax=Nocardia wallacei TaxID=480035 RepID=UPI0024577B4D|nr:hypothetical protein [Nocardia wallacei]